ncbi:hypothetical protein H5410_013277 [Solanum commersonii]|uniref:Uncharacterized protein n=1 Tax=Solanum commersonii TaxID=4109 RepID=A0A9J6AUW5_SOLCO|nr:hypothetical protein H5410_013277 [Solanum commersonii]
MQPPQIHKLVGRPKLKRVREKDEARKREGLWSKSRKGLQMTCGSYLIFVGHNRRRCPLLQKEDKFSKAPQPSEENESVFMPTHRFVASSSRQTSHNQVKHPMKLRSFKIKEKKMFQRAKLMQFQKDEDIVFAPRMISEEKTRLQMKKLQQQPIGSKD